jgi:hypothetical protein
MVRPNGRFETCKSGHYVHYYSNRIREAWRTGERRKALGSLFEMVNSLVLRKTDPICPAPCACDEFMEYFFYVKDPDDIPVEFRKQFVGRFDPSEVDRDTRFIRKHFREDFPRKVLGALERNPDGKPRGKDQSGTGGTSGP